MKKEFSCNHSRMIGLIMVAAVGSWLDLSCAQTTDLTKAGEEILIHIDAGEYDRSAGLPVSAELAVSVETLVTAGLWTTAANGEKILAQVQYSSAEEGKAVASWLLERDLKAGEQRQYSIRYGNPIRGGSERGRPPEIIDTETGIEVRRKGSKPAVGPLILGYVKTATADAATHDPAYTRTGYIHPLRSPSGNVVTGDYPADHVHQHALFFAWTNCTFEGRDIDFWNQKKNTARVRFVSVEALEQGASFCEFKILHRHEDLSAADGKPRPVLDETWQVRTWHALSGYHLIDIVSTQTCASERPLTINKYHYGGMAIRGTADWFVDEKGAEQPGDFLTNEGKTRADGNHSRPNWVDMHGRYADGSYAGVAIFDHPNNFRFPQFVRLHPSKPYFVFTPQVEEGFEIKPGQPYVSRYRYIVHDGEPDPKLLDRLWNDYAHPLKVTVLGEE